MVLTKRLAGSTPLHFSAQQPLRFNLAPKNDGLRYNSTRKRTSQLQPVQSPTKAAKPRQLRYRQFRPTKMQGSKQGQNLNQGHSKPILTTHYLKTGPPPTASYLVNNSPRMRHPFVLVMRARQQRDGELRVRHVALLEQRMTHELRLRRALGFGR